MIVKQTVAVIVLTMVSLLSLCSAAGLAAQDGGYAVTSDLWAKAVLQTPGGPVTLIWQAVGTETTPSGDQVISGYFYADPNDFAYGSMYNPEVFVKIYIATNGWANIAFNHVTVDNVDVYSSHQYNGTPDQTGIATLTNRLVEHQYVGVAIQTTSQPGGGIAPNSTDSGYTVTSGLWAKAILQPPIGPVTLIWKEVGSDTTPSGDRVISGYFYADPNDFAYGSEYNPEVFVKIYIAANGWCNIAVNHVTVDDVDVYSSHQYNGTSDQTGIATLDTRLVEHQYTGVDPNGGGGTGTETPLLPLVEGTWWEYGWTEYESSYAMSDTSASLEIGVYRITLGAAENIGGISMYEVEVSGDPGNYDPSWERIGGDSAGRIYGTAAGSNTLVTLFDPTSDRQWPGAGFFTELRDDVLMTGTTNSTVTKGEWHASHQYFSGPAHSVKYSFEQDNCEYFSGIGNICGGEMDQNVLEIEYWTPELGPVAWHNYSSYSSCGGGFCSGSTSENDVGLYGSSLMGHSMNYLLETGPTSLDDPMSFPNEEGLPPVVAGRVKKSDDEDLGVHDWYEIVLTEETALLATLQWHSTSADLDLYLITSEEASEPLQVVASGQNSEYGSGNSANPTEEEISGVVQPGKYYLGIVAYDAGSLGADYNLVYVDMPSE